MEDSRRNIYGDKEHFEAGNPNTYGYEFKGSPLLVLKKALEDINNISYNKKIVDKQVDIRKKVTEEYIINASLNPYQDMIIKLVLSYKDKKGKKDLEQAKNTIDLLIDMEY